MAQAQKIPLAIAHAMHKHEPAPTNFGRRCCAEDSCRKRKGLESRRELHGAFATEVGRRMVAPPMQEERGARRKLRINNKVCFACQTKEAVVHCR
jgi:hypothetical protein